MYQKTSPSGHTIVWSPNDDELAQESMEAVEGTGVPDHVQVPDHAPVDVGADVAKQVQERYKELHIEKYGTESKFHPDHKGRLF